MLGTSPLWTAYTGADGFGKLIFLSLFALSIATWAILLFKGWLLWQTRRSAFDFQKTFTRKSQHPLTIECAPPSKTFPNPFASIYRAIKSHCVDLLNKNHRKYPNAAFLSSSDLNLLVNHVDVTISEQLKGLEKNLFILSTTVSLAPFLGLLGTVWGSLLTLGGLEQGLSQSNQVVFNGLSMALATTVIGLVVAIPALVAYNTLKSVIRDFSLEMENFATEVMTCVEMQYRKEESSLL